MKAAAILTKEDLSSYFSEVSFRLDIYNEARQKMDFHLASRFNVFDYIKPNENMLSDIFADLLNPKGKHGQKDSFLRAFGRILPDKVREQVERNRSRCAVGRETSTAYIENNQRRMDIMLEFADVFVISIENKPWAGEQENQLEDYRANLARKYDENFCLIYLSGDGSQPESLQQNLKKKLEAQEQLVVLKYSTDLVSWLNACYRVCEAVKIRCFIRDLVRYIEENFENI